MSACDETANDDQTPCKDSWKHHVSVSQWMLIPQSVLCVFVIGGGAQGWVLRTGNLLAPWAAATATGVLRSAYSRVQLPRLRKRRMELLGKLKVRAHVQCQVSGISAHECDALHTVPGSASHAICWCFAWVWVPAAPSILLK